MPSTGPSRPAPTRPIRRALWGAGALGGLAQSLAGAASGLLAPAAGWPDAVAGLPMTAQVTGAAAAGLALSRLTARHGRRAGLATGAAGGALGCAVIAVAPGVLVVVLVGNALIGAGATAVSLGRYAAADLVAERARPAAMAAVLLAVTVGAVTGPNLLGPAALLAAAAGTGWATGSFAMAAAAFAAAAAVLLGGLRGLPRPVAAEPGARPERALPVGAAGIATLALANLVMVAVMTMTPLHLHHGGAGLWAIGAVVSAHIAAMYAPAPLSARLTARAGPRRAAALATAVLVAACAVAAGGQAPLVVGAAMVLLGAGWNLALVAGSALLTAGVPVAGRPRREGLGEAAMGVAAATGGAASGPLLAGGGYPVLAAAGAAAALLVLPVLARSPRPTRAPAVRP
ncbi:MFS transporter [Pseudonocardia humida]|uniref:MFS transporter n=1 Tax=Pseudonocardia humida TaxID=2800819 RepID=A0ABT1AAU5_9PSEU|nr:MFS transporter [Pseudonocardia humida]MCO1660128.1 MFS transporter [Pseudonocardia humida]